MTFINSDKKKFLSFEEIKINKFNTLSAVFPENSEKDIIVYDTIYNKYGNIIHDICALANSDGGKIYIGVNQIQKCIGISMKTRDEWLENILKLSRVLYNTIHTFEMKRIKYYIRNYIVEYNNHESFITEIEVPRSDEQCLVNSFGNISYYGRKEGQTISLPITEDILHKVFMDDEHRNAKYDIGDKFDGEEGEKMEFKPSFKFLKSMDGIGKYLSSFGNTNGGKIIIGVGDDKKILGILIEDSQHWDRIKQNLLMNKNCIKPVEYLTQIRVKRVPLRRKNHFIVNIYIPKSNFEEPIIVRDLEGGWNQWSRVLSSSIKIDKQILYTKAEMNEMEKKCISSEKKYKKLLKDYESSNNVQEAKSSKFGMYSIFGFMIFVALQFKT